MGKKSFFGWVVGQGIKNSANATAKKVKWLKPAAKKVQAWGEYQLYSSSDKLIVDAERLNKQRKIAEKNKKIINKAYPGRIQ